MTKQLLSGDWLSVVRQHSAVEEIVGAGASDRAVVLSATDWRVQLADALESPLDAIALRDTIYPGDKIAISVSGGVPGVSVILPALIEMLVSHGIRPEDIAVFSPLSAESFQASRGISEESGPAEQAPELQVQHVEHQTDEQQAMAMVGVSRHDQPIYLNRHLAEADVVLPIVLMNRDERQTLANSIYPALSSAETQERLRGHDAEQDLEAQDAENLICPFMMIGVIPIPGGERGEVVAGIRHSIQDFAQRRIEELWTIRPAEYPAIVATLERASGVGLWERLRLGLTNAVQMVTDHAPIILILDEKGFLPGSLNASNKKSHRERQRLMSELEEVTRNRPVFLASSHEASQVEELGFGHVGSQSELAKLMERIGTAALLRDADQWNIQS